MLWKSTSLSYTVYLQGGQIRWVMKYISDGGIFVCDADHISFPGFLFYMFDRAHKIDSLENKLFTRIQRFPESRGSRVHCRHIWNLYIPICFADSSDVSTLITNLFLFLYQRSVYIFHVLADFIVITNHSMKPCSNSVRSIVCCCTNPKMALFSYLKIAWTRCRL